jgi:glycerophosphoryl diester phosphodiesterase
MKNMKRIRSVHLWIFILTSIQLSLFSGFNASCQNREGNYFIDAKTPKGLREMFRYTGDSVSFLSCHRGGPERQLPENCTATFNNTLKHTYALLEIDPRYTKDSIIIVHHDRDLPRTTNGKGKVSDFTYNELKDLRLKDLEGKVTEYKIQTLPEMLEWAKGKAVLVLDRKDVPIETRIKMVEDYNAEACAIVMAYTFEEAQLGYRLNKNILMQVFINSPEKVEEFDKTGVPWENIVAFVGHSMPDDPAVFHLIHQKGSLCIVGTSRNLDRDLLSEGNNEDLKEKYLEIFRAGADILETDTPVPLSKLIKNRLSSETYISKFHQSQ